MLGFFRSRASFRFFFNTTWGADIAICNSGHKNPARGVLFRPVKAYIKMKISSTSKTLDMSDRPELV